MPDRPFISHFSPQRTEAELLEEIHVQRHELLAEAVSTMRGSVLSGNKHHLLFIGPRGAGKTHLVRLIHHRLGKQTDLADKMRFAWLNEDETATSFLKLLILIYRDVSQRYPQDFPASDLQSIFGLDADTARERLGERLLKNLGPRTLVVLMENLDSLFKHMPEGEQRIWRAFVQNHPVFATVGTAQSLFDGVADRKQPFFGFFDTRHLTPLDVADATLLLKKIAHLNGQPELVAFLDTSTGHARVKAIHDLAGGNPRIYLIFSDFLTPESLDDLVRPFEETADRQLTSYYQERLRWLSPQQQEIIQFLCHQRGGVPVKNIAEGLFTTHNSITGQLRQLGEYRYLKSTKVGREVLYELAEPLMRLALQIKDTHDKKPLMLIVDFLRVWYEREEIVQHLGKLSPSDAARAYFEEALKLIDSDEPNLRHEIFRKMVSGFDPENCDEIQVEALRTLAKETAKPLDLLTLGLVLIGKESYDEASKAFVGVISSTEALTVNSGFPECYAVGAFLLATGLPPGKDLLRVAQAFMQLADKNPIVFTDHVKALYCESVVRSLSESVESVQLWHELIPATVKASVKHDMLTSLLISMLVRLKSSWDLGLKNLDTTQWQHLWLSALENQGDGQAELKVLLYQKGIDYLQTKDEVVLLSLPLEQRKILRSVLELPPENSA